MFALTDLVLPSRRPDVVDRMFAGLSEKQLQRGLREMVRAKNDEEKSPYAHYSKLQLW